MYAGLGGAVHTVSVQEHEFRKCAALRSDIQYNRTPGEHTRWQRTFFASSKPITHSPFFSVSLETSNPHSTTLPRTPRPGTKLVAPFPPASLTASLSITICLSRPSRPIA